MTDPKKLVSLDEKIAEALRAAEKSGELKGARDYGKPLDFGDGYAETPAELRLAFKVLKDSGFAPAEVAMLQDIAELRKRYSAMDPDSDEARALATKIQDLEIEARLRIERLGRTRNL